jgi:hypothetical protein
MALLGGSEANASAHSPSKLATENAWRYEWVGHCPTFIGPGFGMASRNYNTLIFSFYLILS